MEDEKQHGSNEEWSKDASVANAPYISLDMGECLRSVLDNHRNLRFVVDVHDFEAVEQIARKASCAWLLARTACLQLVAGSRHPSPLVYAAVEAIYDTYAKLLDEFKRASSTIAVAGMSDTLTSLRATMAIARAKPLLNTRPRTNAIHTRERRHGS